MYDTAEKPVIYLKPVTAKRYVLLGMLYVLAGILAWVAVFQPPQSPALLVFLWVLAGGGLLLANAAQKATAQGLQLRDGGIYTDAGDLVVSIAEVRKIERGVFAFKPSNGFILRLHSAQKRGWAPGLWWRFGRFVGIGGVTSKIQAEIMSETIAALIGHTEA